MTFAGQPIPVVTLGSTARYITFGGDISPFAGQTGELLFQGNGGLDNIFLSNLPIPEPGLLNLFGLGALVLGWHYLGRRRRSSLGPA